MNTFTDQLVFDPQIIRRFDINGPRYTSYPTADRFADNVGAENMFIFGNTTPQVEAIRKAGYNPRAIYQQNPMLNETLNKIDGGYFCPSDKKRYHDLFNSLVNYGDHYLLLADYADYVATQSRVDQLYLHPAEWYRKAILNVAGMGTFSSDRTIRDYAIDTWNMGSLLKKA